MQVFLKILNGMANNVEPDQTALIWVCNIAYAILLENLVYEL